MPLPYRWQWRLDRARNALRGFFRPDPQAARPRLCPACHTLVGTKATRCHECGASLNFSLAAVSKSLSGILPSETPITTLIFVVNILLFGVSLLATMRVSEGLNLFGGINGHVLSRMGASRIDLILQGQWWRLLTAVFLHGSLLHIAMNSWVLMDIGPQVEHIYGSARYLFLYIVTGIAGFVLSAFTGHFSIGASGALMGLIGLMIAITSRRGGNYMRMVRNQLIRWVLYIFVIGILISGIDNFAHFGGLASGFLLGRVFEDREPMNASERKRAYALGWLAGLTFVVSFALMLRQYFQGH
ncbi:MAG TPA: rhomboid family intramembrane serine protease [Candidatus Acidoferrales bacterium]|nr:rhomboid family intramembrane serine protease [Candidatus Acidoferrales bacterium]